MRGSISYDNLMYQLSAEDLTILNDVIKENIENTKESGLPLL